MGSEIAKLILDEFQRELDKHIEAMRSRDLVYKILAERVDELEQKLEISMDMNLRREELLTEKEEQVLELEGLLRATPTGLATLIAKEREEP